MVGEMRFDLAAGDIEVFTLQISTPGLGDHSYAVFVNGSAYLIDPQRDIDRFTRIVEEQGAALAAVYETHIHNDYISGGPLLVDRLGGVYVLPENSGSELPHHVVADGDRADLAGGWSFIAIHTPGHTPHHMSYALLSPGGDRAVFTGGSMLVGAVGRSDLLSAELTEPLARDQYHSVRRLAAELSDPTLVAPTHGAGSFCSASTVAATTSTIGEEKLRNPALLAGTEDEFVISQLANYRLYPTYYREMGPANVAGRPAIPSDDLARLEIDDPVLADAVIVDLRPAEAWAGSHIPGSINIPAGDSVGVYAGWVFPWNTPLVLGGSDDQVAAARLHLARIGYDQVVGTIDPTVSPDGVSVRIASFAELRAEHPAVIVDTRDPLEFGDGAVPGAVNIHMSEIPTRVEELPTTDPVWLYCETGYRASVSAGFVAASGRTVVLVRDRFGARTWN